MDPAAENKEGETLDEVKPVAAEPTPEPTELTADGGVGDSLEPVAPGSESDASTASATPPPKKKGLKARLSHVNIYVLLFLLALLIAIMALVIGIQKSKNEAVPTSLTTQTLSTDAINQLKGNDVKVGDSKQTLSIESNAVFAGRILIQGGTDIAGTLKVSGDTSLVNLTTSGTAVLQKAQINDLAVSGNLGIQGAITVQKTINVTGGGSFGGPVTAPQLTVDTLTLTKDLQINSHIDAGGSTPSSSNGASLGAGGTASVSGTDTAGTVVIGTGSGPVAGCFVTVTFTKKFNGSPHVVISAASSDAGGLDYYVNRTTASFSVCANTPAAAKNYTFDYIVID
jgi:hypothetical protein